MAYALEIHDLKKVYGENFEALKGISLNVEEGDFFALLGANGAGKSTTIGVICSLITKTAGKVAIFGQDVDENFPKAKLEVGVVPQELIRRAVVNVHVVDVGEGRVHRLIVVAEDAVALKPDAVAPSEEAHLPAIRDLALHPSAFPSRRSRFLSGCREGERTEHEKGEKEPSHDA